MVKTRIRGVYSTALTKLLLGNGFEVVQPSATQQERFKLKGNRESPDLDIYDRRNLQGVRALGTSESITACVSVLQSRLEDVIVMKWPFTVGGIYKGIVKESDLETRSSLVDFGNAVG